MQNSTNMLSWLLIKAYQIWIVKLLYAFLKQTVVAFFVHL
jgi:hypothetical protein